MPTKKAAKKLAPKPPKPDPRPLYAMPIREAIARGDLKEMRALATKARKHISDVQGALNKLEAKLK